jgi:cell division protein FtsW
VAIGPIAFQPLEFAKLTTVWFLAHTFAGLGPLHKARASHLIVPILLCAAVVGMVGAQPNLSGAVFLILIAFIMAWIGGVNLRLAVPMVLGGLGVFAGLIALNPDRLARFLPVISPLRDLQGVGYQAGLSLWAVTRGGLFGLGPGGSVAMYSLPDHTTDFIYSIICEEWGVAGGILVIGLFGLLGWSAFRLALMQRDTFRLMLGCGVAAMLVLQAGINIGVTLGVFPTTGIPLPFISAGGSSLVLTLGEVGLLLNLGRTAGVQIAREQRVPGCNTPRALHREEVAASPGSKYGRGDRVVYSDRRRRIAR